LDRVSHFGLFRLVDIPRPRPPGSGNSRDCAVCECTYQTYQQQ